MGDDQMTESDRIARSLNVIAANRLDEHLEEWTKYFSLRLMHSDYKRDKNFNDVADEFSSKCAQGAVSKFRDDVKILRDAAMLSSLAVHDPTLYAADIPSCINQALSSFNQAAKEYREFVGYASKKLAAMRADKFEQMKVDPYLLDLSFLRNAHADNPLESESEICRSADAAAG